ncbi:hypothetical protein C0991_004725, partial [Blastosporella zonata]
MFDMGAETMSLPMEEKMRFEQGNEGMSFGYKSAGANAVDASGKKDFVEFINISKDDALAWPHPVHRAYPSSVNACIERTVAPFIRKSLEVNNILMDILNDRLGLPAGTLLSKHLMDETSSSESRVTKTPPVSGPPENPAIGSHTDFGSLSFLHNRLGGLQVLVPGVDTWQYVKVLRPLIKESSTIAEAIANNPKKNFDTGVTSKEWFARRIRNQRIGNRK